jgi:hypothetical protein
MNRVPAIVHAFVKRSVTGPIDVPRGTLLNQRGEMRLDPQGAWLPFTAEQTMEADATGFVWHARVRMAPMVTAVVEDAYEHRKGRLDAKIWGVFPVAHARGVDVDRGEAERYLAELPWCPLALLHNPGLNFEERDDGGVRVWVHEPNTYVDLRFDAEGDIVGARTTTRMRGDVCVPWEGRFSRYRDFGGVRAPSAGEVWWETDHEPFVYWRGEVTELGWR